MTRAARQHEHTTPLSAIAAPGARPILAELRVGQVVTGRLGRPMRVLAVDDCPRCALVRPKTFPSILLPRQRCKVDDYRDPRPRLTDEQHAAAVARAFPPKEIE